MAQPEAPGAFEDRQPDPQAFGHPGATSSHPSQPMGLPGPYAQSPFYPMWNSGTPAGGHSDYAPYPPVEYRQATPRALHEQFNGMSLAAQPGSGPTPAPHAGYERHGPPAPHQTFVQQPPVLPGPPSPHRPDSGGSHRGESSPQPRSFRGMSQALFCTSTTY